MRAWACALVVWMCVAHGCAAYYSPLESPDSVDDGVRALIAWAKQHPFADEAAMELYHFSGFGWGARALRDIEPNTVLVEVPPQYHIHEKLFVAEPYFRATLERVAPPTMHQAYSVRLAVFLLADMSRDAPHHEVYYRACPRTFGIPVEWSDDDLELARTVLAPDQFAYVTRARRSFPDAYARFEEHILRNATLAPYFHPAVSDARHFQWALAIVSTRAWMIMSSSVPYTVLVPFADMINHGCEAPMPRVSRDGLRLGTGDRGYTRGQQILQDYGRKTSFQLMSHYGFVDSGAMLPSGPCEKVSTTLHANDTLAYVVRHVLRDAASELSIKDGGKGGSSSLRLRFTHAGLSPCVLALIRTLLVHAPLLRGDPPTPHNASMHMVPVACDDVAAHMAALGVPPGGWTLHDELDMLRHIHAHVLSLAQLPTRAWSELDNLPATASSTAHLLAAWRGNMRTFLASQRAMGRALWRDVLLTASHDDAWGADGDVRVAAGSTIDITTAGEWPWEWKRERRVAEAEGAGTGKIESAGGLSTVKSTRWPGSGSHAHVHAVHVGTRDKAHAYDIARLRMQHHREALARSERGDVLVKSTSGTLQPVTVAGLPSDE